MVKYIIEHLEPELYEWCLIEYRHISEIVGKENLVFTNINTNIKNKNELTNLGRVEEKPVKELNLKNSCLLNPVAKKTLTPEDKFDYLVFGGILGDDPPQGRTEKAFANLKCKKRNLGNKQMSTDTAVYVAKKIADGKKFSEIEFIDELVIPVGQGEEIILPFRFAIENGKPLLAKGYIEFVKRQEMF